MPPGSATGVPDWDARRSASHACCPPGLSCGTASRSPHRRRQLWRGYGQPAEKDRRPLDK
jgi:hypothetical protein